MPTAQTPRKARPIRRTLVCGLLLGALLAPATAPAQDRLQPGDFRYLGAFRLPDAGERPLTFAWGAGAMTFRPAQGRAPGRGELPGSLYLMGHDRMAYGALPNGNQLAELAIPAPVASRDLDALPVARFLQGFHDVAAGQFVGLDELPRVGLAWLDTAATGPLLHLAWGAHFQPETPAPSHAWISPDLANPDFTGPWFVGDGLEYANNDYLFAIPDGWARAHLGGPALATGRYRDGGWSGMGPALFAYRPWQDEAGTPAPAGATLAAVPLLHYTSSRDSEDIVGALAGYQHPDEWSGGAWIETASGKSALLIAGTKSVGAKYWYGFVNPAGPDLPCVAGDFVGQFPVCRLADGSPCAPADLTECANHNDFRGWWSTAFTAEALLYDPDDLARVAAGQSAPNEPQPYAVVSLDAPLYHNPAGIEPETLGVGVQQHYRLGPVAWDGTGGRLYVVEMFADGDKPVVHVWALD